VVGTVRLAAARAVGRTAGLAVAVAASPAWADHAVGLRSEGWSPLTAALVFGALALLAGAVVVIVVTVLTRRDDSPPQ
jgi:hypothetical protein